MKRGRIVAGVALAILVATVLVVTGSAAGGSAASTKPLVVVSPIGVPSLDREAFGTSTQQEVLTNVNEPLLRFKPLSKKNRAGVLVSSATELVGGLCVKHAVSADGKKITCELGNFKSPYGNEITAADVKWTFDYMISAKNIGLLIMGLTSIDVKNPVTILGRKKLTINLTERNSITERALTFFFFSPYDSREVKKHATKDDPFGRKWLATHTAGFGPYHVTSIQPNRETRLVVNPNYRGDPAAGVPVPTIKEIVYRAVPDNGTRAQLLRAGAAHLAKSIDLGMFKQLQGSTTTRTYKFPYNAMSILYFNTKMEPFTQALIRKAIACAVDKEEISQKTYFGQFRPAHSIITPKVAGFTPEYDVCPKQDLDKARSFLRQARSTNLEVPLFYSKGNSGQDAEDNATLIQAQLAKAGVKANLQHEPDATKFFVGAIVGQYPMFIFTIGSNVPDAGWTFGSWFGPGGVLNFNKFEHPGLTAALRKIKQLPIRSAERRAAIRDFQHIQMENQTVVPLVELLNLYILHRSVCGLRSDPGDFFYWQYLHFCK